MFLKFNISGGVKYLLVNRRNKTRFNNYSKHFKRYLEIHRIPNVKAEGEEEYLKKWRQLTDKVEPYSYRFLSHYYGTNPNIMPEYIANYIVQAALNPERYRPYYHDKNMYSRYVPSQNLPKTIARRINGSAFLDEDYHALNQSISQALHPYIKVILKPTVETGSAKGVMLFVKTDEEWHYVKDESVKLTEKFLLEYSKDFIIQECIEQHEQMAFLNPSSVNILKIVAYRSVKDEKSHVLGALINIGRSGEFVSNSCYGGQIMGLDIETGMTEGLIYDLIGGNCSKEWNGIDYSSSHFRVPSWCKVKQLVEEVTSNMHPMHIAIYDIAIDKSGIPKLIELQVDEYGFWVFYFSKYYALEDYMDEIIEYCKERRAQPQSMRLVEWG
jgi:hypothetical protein